MKTKVVALGKLCECVCGHVERDCDVRIVDGSQVCRECYEYGIHRDLRNMTTLKETRADEGRAKNISEII